MEGLNEKIRMSMQLFLTPRRLISPLFLKPILELGRTKATVTEIGP